jgi:hypothetical protein
MTTPPKPEFILLLEEVNKSFEGFKAISNLTLYLDVGELRVIIERCGQKLHARPHHWSHETGQRQNRIRPRH